MEETQPDVEGERRAGPTKLRRRLPVGTVLSVVVGLVGIAALVASGWVYGETRRDILRLSTDIAQLRLAIELYGRQQPAPASPDEAGLTELSNRLAILEQSWRSAPPTPAAPTLPALPPAAMVAGDDDCLPSGTRFMVAAGDRYPVCGTGAVVEIGSVDDGFIALADGTIIAQGGTIGLPNSSCMIGVVPTEGSAISGFAEIRVTC